MVAFRCAASAENEELDISLERADLLIERILRETSADVLEGWLTGSNNFRYEIDPSYKANRKDKPPPRWLQDTREHLVVGWGCRISDGCEADDELGISQYKGDGNTVIVSNDKDFYMIPGEHYNPINGVARTVSPREAISHFYYQLLMGDAADNIMGYDGKARKEVPKFLQSIVDQLHPSQEELDMFRVVATAYASKATDNTWDMRMVRNMNLLWIQREPNQRYSPPEDALGILNELKKEFDAENSEEDIPF